MCKGEERRGKKREPATLLQETLVFGVGNFETQFGWLVLIKQSIAAVDFFFPVELGIMKVVFFFFGSTLMETFHCI